MTKQGVVRGVLLNLRKMGLHRFDLLGVTQIIRDECGIPITDGSVSRYIRFENADPESPVRNRCINRRKSWYEFEGANGNNVQLLP